MSAPDTSTAASSDAITPSDEVSSDGVENEAVPLLQQREQDWDARPSSSDSSAHSSHARRQSASSCGDHLTCQCGVLTLLTALLVAATMLPSVLSRWPSSLSPATVSADAPPVWPLPLPSLRPTSFHCDSTAVCPGLLSALYTVDVYSPASSHRLAPFPVNSTALQWEDGSSLSGAVYPAEFSTVPTEVDLGKAAAGENRDEALAVLLKMCNNDTAEAARWQDKAEVAERALRTAEAESPVAVMVDGRLSYDDASVRRLLMLLEMAVDHLPAQWRLHLWITDSVLSTAVVAASIRVRAPVAQDPPASLPGRCFQSHQSHISVAVAVSAIVAVSLACQPCAHL